jgi:hypothetical protein
MQQPDENTLTRMHKLLELAKRGVGGEAVNAERFLCKMLAKHGMQLSDITGDEQQRAKVELKWRTTEDRSLLLQIIAKVTDDSEFLTWVRRGKKVLIVELTPAEHAEVLMYEAALAPALVVHMRRAMQAFIQVNQLFPTTSKSNDDETPIKPMDKAELEAIVQMMAATQRTSVRKALPKSS